MVSLNCRRHEARTFAEHQGGGAPLVMSVVIINYNYERYLEQCIRSVLDQSLREIEIIVIDDGSADNSLHVIESILDPRLRYVSQPNSGMIAAMNRGFAEARAPLVAFIDADDYLLPGALRSHVENLSLAGVVRSQGYMEVIRNGMRADTRIPGRNAPDGDLTQIVLRRGPGALVSTPNSGNAWSRNFLCEIFPLPDGPRGLGAETFLMDSAPLYGLVKTTNNSVAAYRQHEGSMSLGKKSMTAEVMSKSIEGYVVRAAHLAKLAKRQGYSVDEEDWLSNNWRILTLQDLLARNSMRFRRPGLVQHLLSFRAVPGWHKKMAVALLIIGLRALPGRTAARVAENFIHLHYM